MADSPPRKGFWTSLTGLIVAVAGLISAVVGAYVAVQAIVSKPASSSPSVSPAMLKLSTLSQPFADVQVGTSAARDIGVTYTGGESMAVTAELDGADKDDFKIGNSCPIGGMNDGDTCVVSVYFVPNVAGLKSARLIVTGPGDRPHVEAGLQGNALPPGQIVFDPPAGPVIQLLSVGSTPAKTSGSASLKIVNFGAGTVQIGTVTTKDSRFSISPNCNGRPLLPGASCLVTVIFKTAPGETGTFHAMLQVSDTAPNSPQTVPLTGYRGPPIIQWQIPALPPSVIHQIPPSVSW